MVKKKQEIDSRVIQSRMVQMFKSTPYYEMIYEKLNKDYKKFRDVLVEKEDPEIRGRVKYINELFSWIDSISQEELSIEAQKQQVEQDNDW